MRKDRQTEHEIAWDLIPWIVNGSALPDERQRAMHHIESCEICAAELRIQNRLFDMIAATEDEDRRQEASLRCIEEQLDSYEFSSSLSAPWWREIVAMPRRLVFAGALVAATLALLLNFNPPSPGYQTLTTPDEVAGGVELRLRARDDVASDEVEQILLSAGALEVRFEAGSPVARAIVPADRKQEIMDDLQNSPMFLVVTGD